MTVHPVRSVHALSTHPPQRADTSDAAGSPNAAQEGAPAFDSTWATSRESVPETQSSNFEQMMVSGGKIYVVLAVVLIIWFGLVVLLFRTDNRIAQLEEEVDAQQSRALAPEDSAEISEEQSG